MLKIRKEQVARLATGHWGVFLGRVCIHWRKSFPQSVGEKTDEELCEIIEEECARAHLVGLECERDLILYLDTGALLGWGWQENPDLPWATELHEDEDLSASMRANAFWKSARNELQKHSANR